MTTNVYWVGSVLVVDWTLTDLDGEPVNDATVTGTVTLPDRTTTAPMGVAPAVDGLYRLTYEATEAGWHTYALTATGSVVDAEEGSFHVRAPLADSTVTLDPTTDIGLVRLLISDTDPTAILFTDAEITAFLTLEGGTKRAASQALDTLASNEVMVSKVIKTLDLATDGAKVAAELRARAAVLRSQADATDTTAAGDDTWGLEIVDFDPYAAYRGL